MEITLNTKEQRQRDSLGLIIPYTEAEIKELEAKDKALVEQECEL